MWSLGLALAVLPWVSGCDGQLVNSASAATENTNQEVATPPAAVTTATNLTVPDPDVVENSFENASATVVSAPTVPGNRNLSDPALEIVKLTQAGVDESVMMAYVTNSQKVFNLTSEDIIYLNDLGVPDAVVTAMMQQDQAVKAGAAVAAAAPPTVQTNEPIPESMPYQPPDMVGAEQPPVAEAPLTPPDNPSYSYFYDSLAPYGSWVNVSGYGMCWQPTVVVVNPGWSPYCDRGHWVYSDCGWYWASDYSWGWAPFHYGRWFHHSHLGWCWAPDTVWGPSWVSWRYSNDYCGWAPLPPYACFTPGIGFTYCGRSVGATFTFGVGAGLFTFVPTSHFQDHHPDRHRLSVHDSARVFHNTVFVNQVVRGGHDRLINRGVPVSHITAATRTQIHPVHVERTDQPATFAARRDQNDRRTLTAFSPNLPQPDRASRFVGQTVPLAPRSGTQTASRSTSTFAIPNQPSVTGNQSPGSSGRRNRNDAIPQNQPSVTRTEPQRDNQPWQPGVTGSGQVSPQNQNPVTRAERRQDHSNRDQTAGQQNQPSITRNDGRQNNANGQTGGANAGRHEPLILRGSRPTGSANNNATANTDHSRVSTTWPGFAANQQQQPSEPALPVDNSRTPRRDSSPWQSGVQQQQQQEQPQNPFIIRNQSARQESPRSRQQDNSQGVQTAPLQPVQTYRWPQGGGGGHEQQRQMNPPASTPQPIIPQNHHAQEPPRSSPAPQMGFGSQGSQGAFAPPPQNNAPPPQAAQGQGQMRSGNGNGNGNGNGRR
jgi:hypothetical protein